MFQIKSEVLPTVRKNFSRKCKNSHICPSCKNTASDIYSPQEDTQRHLMFDCPTFVNQRMDKDLVSSDSDLIQFFKSVISYRMENNED